MLIVKMSQHGKSHSTLYLTKGTNMDEQATNNTKEEALFKVLNNILEKAVDEAVNDAAPQDEQPDINPPGTDKQPPSYDYVDLSLTSLEDKLTAVLHSTFDDILVGKVAVESGTELKDLATAVAIREQLRA